MPRTKSAYTKETERVFFEQGYGAEPTPDSNILDALNWYSYSCDDRQAKKYLLTYFTNINDEFNYDLFNNIDSKIIYGYASTSCWYARMLTNGFEKINFDQFWKYLENVVRKVKIIENEKKIEISRPSFNPMSSRVLNNAYQALNEILDAIDIIHPRVKDANISVDAVLKKYAVNKFYKSEFLNEFKSLLADIEIAIAKTDEEILQSFTRIGYSNLMMKRKRDFLINVIFYTETYFDKVSKRQKITDVIDIETGTTKQVIETVEKKTRKLRKKKFISPEKRISRVQYMKSYPELKLTSIDPKKLLGANELWLFNTRYSQLQVYRAKSETGFDIKGTTLLNFDEAKSQTKRIGRHTDEVLNKILTAGKVVLRRVMDEITSTGTECNGRLGEHTIIMRAL